MGLSQAIVRWVDRSMVRPVDKGPLIPFAVLVFAGGELSGVRFAAVTCWVLAGLWVMLLLWRWSIYMRAARRIKPGSPEAKRFILDYGNE